jgi:hypothetical protein
VLGQFLQLDLLTFYFLRPFECRIYNLAVFPLTRLNAHKKCLYRCPQKRRRVHNSVIHRKILTICTPNQMIVNRLQNGPTNSSTAPRTSRVNCQKKNFKWDYIFFFLVILIEILTLKTTMYHKYTLEYQKFTIFFLKNATIDYVPFCAKH